jgi:hypothetical protein
MEFESALAKTMHQQIFDVVEKTGGKRVVLVWSPGNDTLRSTTKFRVFTQFLGFENATVNTDVADDDDDGFFDIPHWLRVASSNILKRDMFDAMASYKTTFDFCKRRNLNLVSSRPIRDDGSILWCLEKATGSKCIVKHQPFHDAHHGTSPALAELKALVCLNVLMKQDTLGPWFAELIGYEKFVLTDKKPHLSLTLQLYGTDLTRWMNSACATRPPSALCVGAEKNAPWVYQSGAGRCLAESRFDSDHALFRDILTTTILQVLLGLAQAQRAFLFSHNDLHAANVLFDLKDVAQSRLYVTGLGCFFVPPGMPNARLIDFQHATFDVRDVDTHNKLDHVCAHRNDLHNAFALAYDVWRFLNYITLELCTPGTSKWDALGKELQEFLWLFSDLKGPVGAVPHHRDADETVWTPYILKGALPEQVLKHSLFDRFRAPMTTPAHLLYYETPPCEEAQRSYLMRKHVCNYTETDATVPRAVCRDRAAVEDGGLALFRQDVIGNLFARTNLMFKHSPNARARFLLMEAHLFTTVMAYFHANRDELVQIAENAQTFNVRAVLDALSVTVHHDWFVFSRPFSQEFEAYHALVKQLLSVPKVRTIIYEQPVRPCVDDALFFKVQDEADLERLKIEFHKLLR